MWPGARVLVKGGGDLATGVAHRLWQAGFAVIISELPAPLTVRRTVAFATAVHEGAWTVEGVTAVRIDASSDADADGDCSAGPRAGAAGAAVAAPTVTAALAALARGQLPVLVEPRPATVAALQPAVVVDAIMAKRNTGTRRGDAPVVIALGPGFTAGGDADAVIETNRGHDLGRVILAGSAAPDTGVPGEIGGYGVERLLRAPRGGVLRGLAAIGDRVAAGQVVAQVEGQPVTARIDGVLRGLIRDGTAVTAGLKVGDVDPRAAPEHCHTISDKARAVAGGVLEAALHLLARR